MRMWNVPTDCLCRKHLLGEHVEMHMVVGAILKGKRLDGYLKNQLMQISLITSRHNQLAAELVKRGCQHKSPLPKFTWNGLDGIVDAGNNIGELYTRCADCRKLITLKFNLPF